MAYRDPVPVYVNYFFGNTCLLIYLVNLLVFKDDLLRKVPANRAAAIVQAAMQFRDIVVRYTCTIVYIVLITVIEKS